MRSWLREDVLRRVLKNTGLLGLGKAAGALLHLATLALSARLLGPYAFGLLILVRSYAQTASGLAKFQSWQTLIRFGAVRAERRDIAGFLDLAALTVLIDAASGGLALLAAVMAVQFIGADLGISKDVVGLAQLYCLAIPFMSSATPTGVLRIFNRFAHLSAQSVVTPAVRLAGIAIAGFSGASLGGFVVAWLISDLIGELYLWLQGFRELQRQNYLGLTRSSPRRAVRANAGVVRFAIASNLTATLNQAIAPLLTLVVGGLLGAAAAGVYRAAQVVVEAVSTPAELVTRSLFPEAARLVHQPSQFWRLIARSLVLAGLLGMACSLMVMIAGPTVAKLAMGPGYDGLGPILRILAAGFIPIVGTFPLETALLALGGAGRLLVVRSCAAAIVLGAAFLLGPSLGLVGVAAAATLGAFVACIGLIGVISLERRSASLSHL